MRGRMNNSSKETPRQLLAAVADASLDEDPTSIRDEEILVRFKLSTFVRVEGRGTSSTGKSARLDSAASLPLACRARHMLRYLVVE